MIPKITVYPTIFLTVQDSKLQHRESTLYCAFSVHHIQFIVCDLLLERRADVLKTQLSSCQRYVHFTTHIGEPSLEFDIPGSDNHRKVINALMRGPLIRCTLGTTDHH